jgi:hypothetical protein
MLTPERIPPFKATPLHLIVLTQEMNQGGTGLSECVVQGGKKPLVLFVPKDAGLFMTAVRRKDICAIVCRGIIDDDELVIVERLSKDRIETPSQVVRAVVDREDNRESWATHDERDFVAGNWAA